MLDGAEAHRRVSSLLILADRQCMYWKTCIGLIWGLRIRCCCSCISHWGRCMDEKAFKDTKHGPYLIIFSQVIGMGVTQTGVFALALECGLNVVRAFGISLSVVLTLGLYALPFENVQAAKDSTCSALAWLLAVPSCYLSCSVVLLAMVKLVSRGDRRPSKRMLIVAMCMKLSNRNEKCVPLVAPYAKTNRPRPRAVMSRAQ